ASALTAPRDAAPVEMPMEDAEASPRRHPIRTALILVVLAALLGGALWGGWSYTQSRYYVGGTDDGTIAIFQGIPGTIAGFALSPPTSLTDPSIEPPPPPAQHTAGAAIGADTEADARRQLQNLLDPSGKNVLPYCPPRTNATTPAASPGTSASPS